MIELGEVRKAKELNYKAIGNSFIRHACVDCGKERWVQLKRGEPKYPLCHPCAVKRKCSGRNSYRWKGGRTKPDYGYIKVRLEPDDFFYPMASKRNYVLEHRLVVARALNRCLLPWEVVHHKGTKYPLGSVENKQDNRYPENLELLPTKKYHLIDALSRASIARLEKRVTSLEAENILLREQIKSSEKIYDKR